MTDENGSKNFADGHLTVFHNNVVYICDDVLQFSRMKVSVELAGGSALLLESKPRSLTQLTADKSVFMYCDPKSQPAWYKDCTTYLTRLDHSKVIALHPRDVCTWEGNSSKSKK